METKPTFWERYKEIIYVAVITTLILLWITSYCERQQEAAGYAALNEALNDTIKYYTNDRGEKVARITSLETARTEDILSISTKDKDIRKLQSVIQNYKKQLKDKGSVTVFDSESNYEETVKTDVPIIQGAEGGQGLSPKGSYVALPYSFTNRDTTWLSFRFTIDRDSTTYNIKTRDSYSVVIGEESQGWFKKPKPFADVTNENPHSSTKTLRSWNVSTPKPKRWHIGPVAGYGIGPNFEPQWFVGGGISWSILSF